ncbi:DnaB-like helicase N-terminal domain-containing protein [Verrucomicrobium spinosum]|uniref:DnaB-like helicase N-terminal domain-containing protein n=1 Tax=Verrucomicrobium spinosum TaxID=2736 RepID=UPI0009461FB4|nr:DnaB-like helicase N-terminal domain-containing protein [Verrucomicrobium spinosum]
MTLQDIQIPFSDDAERGVLSCMICRHDVALEAQLELKDEHFYHPANRLIFQTIKTMVAEERPTELPAMSVFFMDMGLMDKIGGPATLAELYAFVPTPAHYDYYRDILKQKLKLRKVIEACTEVLQSVQEVGHGDADVLVDAAGERFYEIAAQEQTCQGTFKEKLMEYTNVWEARALGQVETGIPTRWRSWNATFGGITPRMWLIAGYPSDGKSSLAQGLVEDTLVHGGDVLWFMYEMDDTETIDRLVSSRSQLESKKVFFPQHHPLQQGEARRVSKAVGR